MKKVFFLVASIIFLASCGGSKSRESQVGLEASDSISAVDDRGYIVKVGDIAPDFMMLLNNGDSVSLSSQKGKIVMLQFTASWCGVCRREMPFIQADIYDRYKDHPEFVLWGIDREEPLDTINSFAARTGITYPIGLDPKADIFASYAERNAGITRNVIIDRDGRIAMLTRLYEAEEFKQMCEKIDSLMQNK